LNHVQNVILDIIHKAKFQKEYYYQNLLTLNKHVFYVQQYLNVYNVIKAYNNAINVLLGIILTMEPAFHVIQYLIVFIVSNPQISALLAHLDIILLKQEHV